MTLPMREGLAPATRLHEEVERMFRNFGRGMWPWPEEKGWMPALDIYEKENQLVIEAELPGIAKENVHLTHQDHTLVIEGATTTTAEEKKEGYFRTERRTGNFYRAITLPEDVTFEGVKAEFKNGVLTVMLPKAAHPTEMPREIPVTG